MKWIFRYNRDITVYAARMDTSISALNKFAKAYLGRSVYELLGFSDLPYFSRWFKQRNGVTAKVYRKGFKT
ncbi:hypothetical protein DBR11_27265 [Pedobacter sp. HMWF019]|nr:hypothetical protein DBR11_27265 [Pedobacter sp. HMWF019]